VGGLTTHVLDTARGRPGVGITVKLYAVGDERQLLKSTVTNEDGRTEEPLLQGEAFRPGVFELVFSVGEYFARAGMVTSEPAFLDQVSLRFGIADDAHYHVPLLVSPWSYSTYRGS
jgi:5-hydroxyisourate hydrolase